MMNKLRSFFQNRDLRATVWYFGANLFLKAFAFLTIPIFTRLLSTEDYGYVNNYSAWVSIFTVFIGLGMNAALNSIQKKGGEDFKQFQSAVLFLSFLGFLVISGVLFAARAVFQIDLSPKLFLLALLQAYAAFVISFISQEFMLQGKYKKYAAVNVLPSLIFLPLCVWTILTVFQDQRYLGRILPNALVLAAVGAGIFLYILLRGKKLVDWQVWKRALIYCTPIIFHSISLVVLNQVDRIMITNFYGYSESGIYSFTHNIGLVPQVVSASLESVWVAWFYRSMREKAPVERINTRTKLNLNIMGYLTILFIFVSPEMVKLITVPDYWPGIYYLAPLALAPFVIFMYTFPVNKEYFEGKTVTMAWASLAAALCNIALNYIFIPRFGGVAAAYTTLASYGLLFVIHILRSHRMDRTLFPFRMYGQAVAVVVIMTAVFYLLIDFPLARWGVMLVFAIGYGLFLLKKYRAQKEKGA